MLEALVRVTAGKKDSPKAKGDIVCVKLSPAVWGTMERKQFIVTKLEDAILESKLLAMRAAGEPFPVISLPYAEFAGETLVQQSTKEVKVDSITKVPQGDIKDPTKEKPVLEKTDVVIETRVSKLPK